MNIAGKGVLLLGVFVAIGIIVLSEGFNDTSNTAVSPSVVQSSEETNEAPSTNEEETNEENNVWD